MKYILTILLTAAAAFSQSFPRYLICDYFGAITPSLALHFYQSPDLSVPLTNWTAIGVVENVKPLSNAVPVTVSGPVMYYAVKASNDVAEVFSVVLTVAPPGQGVLRLGR